MKGHHRTRAQKRNLLITLVTTVVLPASWWLSFWNKDTRWFWTDDRCGAALLRHHVGQPVDTLTFRTFRHRDRTFVAENTGISMQSEPHILMIDHTTDNIIRRIGCK